MFFARRVWILAAVLMSCVGAFLIYRGQPEYEVPRQDRLVGSEKKQQRDGDSRHDVPTTSTTDLGTEMIDLPSGMIGSAACIGCHPDQYKSYLSTHHSRSLQRNPDSDAGLIGILNHPPSRRSYEVVSSGEQVWHAEWQHVFPESFGKNGSVKLSPTDSRILLARFPVKYVMGSGAFAKGYLLSDGPYLIQSPVTWYSSPNAFGMAPGYEQTSHQGVTRVLTDECLFCHTGIVSRRNQNQEQVDILEASIGCERCHGPGDAHSNKFSKLVSNAVMKKDESVAATTPQAASVSEDSLIVHPGKLERVLAEAICAQCHLQGDVVVDGRDKTIWDFRPGERLDDTRVIFKIDSSKNEEKTFVDHFDQLWQSKCYQESETLTCITCHDPHHSKVDTTSEQYQQANCLKCHQDEACGVEQEERHLRNENRCVLCHMPKSTSEVPHAATTNHQIGMHTSQPEVSKNNSEAQLRQLRSPLDADVNTKDSRASKLAMAFWELRDIKQNEFPSHLSDQTANDLLALAPDDASDAKLLATIAQLARKNAEALPSEANSSQAIADWDLAERYASQTLRLESAPTESRKAALEVIASTRFNDGDFQKASEAYGELVGIRRSAIDWYNLGLCFGRLKRFNDAERAFVEATRVDASYTPPYRSLAILYSSFNPALSERMRQTHGLLTEQQRLIGQ